jgi:hypothetical protein
MVGILTAKGCRKQRRAVWRVGKVDPASETRRPDKSPGPPPVSRPSPGKRKCLSQFKLGNAAQIRNIKIGDQVSTDFQTREVTVHSFQPVDGILIKRLMPRPPMK